MMNETQEVLFKYAPRRVQEAWLRFMNYADVEWPEGLPTLEEGLSIWEGTPVAERHLLIAKFRNAELINELAGRVSNWYEVLALLQTGELSKESHRSLHDRGLMTNADAIQREPHPWTIEEIQQDPALKAIHWGAASRSTVTNSFNQMRAVDAVDLLLESSYPQDGSDTAPGIALRELTRYHLEELHADGTLNSDMDIVEAAMRYLERTGQAPHLTQIDVKSIPLTRLAEALLVLDPTTVLRMLDDLRDAEEPWNLPEMPAFTDRQVVFAWSQVRALNEVEFLNALDLLPHGGMAFVQDHVFLNHRPSPRADFKLFVKDPVSLLVTLLSEPYGRDDWEACIGRLLALVTEDDGDSDLTEVVRRLNELVTQASLEEFPLTTLISNSITEFERFTGPLAAARLIAENFSAEDRALLAPLLAKPVSDALSGMPASGLNMDRIRGITAIVQLASGTESVVSLLDRPHVRSVANVLISLFPAEALAAVDRRGLHLISFYEDHAARDSSFTARLVDGLNRLTEGEAPRAKQVVTRLAKSDPDPVLVASRFLDLHLVRTQWSREEQGRAFGRLFAERFGDNVSKWTLALELLPNWDDTLIELVETVEATE